MPNREPVPLPEFKASYKCSHVTANILVLNYNATYRYRCLDLTFYGHPRSKFITQNDSTHMIYYMCSMLSNCLRWAVKEILAYL